MTKENKKQIEEVLLRSLFRGINKEANKFKDYIGKCLINPMESYEPIKSYLREEEKFIKKNRRLVKFEKDSASIEITYKAKMNFNGNIK